MKFSADFLTFIEEILNGKLHFLCFDFDEVLLDRAVVKLPEVKQIRWKRLIVGRVVDQKKVSNFHFHFQRDITSLVSGIKLQIICARGIIDFCFS